MKANIFDTVFNSGKEIANNLQTVSAVIALIAAVIAGICFFLTKRQADEGKEKIGRIIMGVALVVLAPSAIVWAYTTFGASAPAF